MAVPCGFGQYRSLYLCSWAEGYLFNSSNKVLLTKDFFRRLNLESFAMRDKAKLS